MGSESIPVSARIITVIDRGLTIDRDRIRSWFRVDPSSPSTNGEKKMKVKVRLMGTKKEVERLRRHLLKKHPQMILNKPREGTNPRYAEVGQKWFVYGDYEFGTIRRRRNQG